MTAPMQTITIPDAKADPFYQTSQNSLMNALAQYKAQQQLQSQQYDTNYNQGLHNMGWDPSMGSFNRNTPGDYGDAVYTNENDFAGRGILKSGPYAEAYSRINTDFGNRKTAADTARQQAADTRTQDLNAFQGQQTSVSNMALSDALARIASKYGVDIANVPQGTTSQVQREVFG